MALRLFRRKQKGKDGDDLLELDQQGCELATRYRKARDPADLQRAIQIFEQLVARTPPDSPNLVPCLRNLWLALGDRYLLLRSVDDLDRQIEIQEQVVSLIPPGSPELAKQRRVLEVVRRERARRGGEPADLVDAFEQALVKAGPDSPDRPKLLSGLGISLAQRHSSDGDPADLDRAIEAFHEATTLAPPDSSDLPQQLGSLGTAHLARFQLARNPGDVDRAVEAFRRATTLAPSGAPELPGWFCDLANAHLFLYEHNADLDALERAIEAFDRSVALTPPDSPDLAERLHSLGAAIGNRYFRQKDEADLDRAIEALERAVALTPADSPHHAGRLSNLEKALALRDRRRVKPAAVAPEERPPAELWREVRVFISSTFRDMHAERDHMVRFVFPRLREELRKRRLHLVDVDLRWGVTADQDAFELCMDEIERCHPRFICMLGGRYGWVPLPETLPRDVVQSVLAGSSPAGELAEEQKLLLMGLYTLDEEAGLYRLGEKPHDASQAEAWQRRTNSAAELLLSAGLEDLRSITASEVHHGALARLDVPTFRYFYFRNPDATASVPAEHARDYREPPGSAAEVALSTLKARVGGAEGVVTVAPSEVAERQLPVHEYDCSWDPATDRFVNLTSFGERVYADLLDSVDAEFGAAPLGEADPRAEEVAAAEAFVETQLGTWQAAGDEPPRECYVIGSRQPVFETLRTHAEGKGGNGTLCIVGPAGIGKSALLAKFYRGYVQGTEGQAGHDDDLVIPHFVGVNATHPRDVLYRLCYELAVGAGIGEAIPFDYDGLREAFPRFLQQAVEVKRVLLLVDGVDQLDRAGAAWPAAWLPDSLPEGARIILTAAPGAVLDGLRARRIPPEEVALNPLIERDTVAIMDAYLRRYRKTLERDQLDALLAKQDVTVPLYLVTALEELRTLGTYELTPRIREMPGELRSLFDWILNRLEQDPGFRDERGQPVGRAVVEKTCSYLSIGRSGMAEAELAQLVAPAAEAGESPADLQGNVAALQRLLRPYLMQRGERVDFYHARFREAIQARYFQEERARTAAHHAVARYFRRVADPAGDGNWAGATRGLSELPYHLTKAGEWAELHDALTDFRFLGRKAATGLVERTGTAGRRATVYTGVFGLQRDFELALASLPQQASHHTAALEAFARALRRESHVLSRRPGILWQQLYNRLQFESGPVQQILEAELARRREAGEVLLMRVRAPLGESTALLQTLSGHTNAVRACAISTDGSFIASASLDRTVKLWDITSGQERATMVGHSDAVIGCAISPDDRFVVSAGYDNTLKVWDVQTGAEQATLTGHTGPVNGCAISPDGAFIVSASWDSTLKLWDANTGAERATLEGHDDALMACAISPDGAFIVSASQDGALKIWDARTGAERATLTGHAASPLGWVSGCAVSPDGTFIVSAAWDGTLIIWDARTGTQRATLRGHTGPVNGCAISPDGALIVSSGRDSSCRIWDVESGAVVATLTGHSASVNSCAISPDGSLIVSASQDGTLKVWGTAR